MAQQTRSIQTVLPPEVLISISDFVASLADLNALARTNKGFYDLLNTRLHKRDATNHNAWALTWAAIHDRESTARLSVGAGADVQGFTDDDPRVKDCTRLILAAYHGSLDVLKLLLSYGEVNPNSRDRKYVRPPLSWAIKQGQSGVVRTLLSDPRIDANLGDRSGNTPLMYAVDHRPDLIPVLLQRGHADPSITNDHNVTALARASAKGIEETDLLLAAHVQLILDGNDSDEHCQHVFFHAAVAGSLDVVKYMVEYFGDKLDPNGANGAHGRGAFSNAAEKNRVEVVRYLCGWEQTNPNLSDPWSHGTPLFSAAMNGQAEMVKVLLECDRVDLEVGNARGTTALGIAAMKNQAEIIRILLFGPRRADPNTPDDNTHTPLFLAACLGNLKAVEALLEAEGLEPNRGDEFDGTTPLEIAKQYGHDEVAEILENHLGELSHFDVDIGPYL